MTVVDGRIAKITEIIAGAAGPFETWLAPGFVDAHVHIESSMLVPSEFARLATVHGTVATVSDPHEIANVLGVAGVDFMLADAARSPLKVAFGAPSCVPATSFDHAGAHLGPAEVASLLAKPEIAYLSEMMNYPGVVHGDPEVMAKIAAAKEAGKPIDGHAPRLSGSDLVTYVTAGITTDHECTTIEEAREKLTLGMKILIREGSAAKNFEALWPLLAEAPRSCMLCSDDKHPNDLVEGHLNELVRRSIELGIDRFDVWRAASLNPVEHYGLNVGLLREGDPADFIELNDLDDVRVVRTWIDGKLVAERGEPLLLHLETEPINQFEALLKRPGEFLIAATGKRARVIEALDGQLVTRGLVLPVKIRDVEVVADVEHDLLKIALVDRYSDVPPAVAIIKGFGLKQGAIASSVSHDSHNIVAVGVDDESLARAVNLVIEERGGLAAVGPDVELAQPLPVAGLMSNDDGYAVAGQYARLDAAAKGLGSTLAAPFMTLSFMALLVIPALKLGPEGLFDVETFQPVPLFVD